MQAYIMPLSVNNVIMARVDYLYFAGASCSGMSQTLDEGCTISDDCSTITCKMNFVEKPITFKLKVSIVIFSKYLPNMVKVRKNEQQKTRNLSCNIAVKRVEQRCCAFYHPHQTCKKRNISFHLLLQQCCKTSCTFFVARFSVPLRM